jgi:hypothetical protein
MLRPTQIALAELDTCRSLEELTDFVRTRDIAPRLPKPTLERTGEIRWDLVNGYTGEPMQTNVGMAKQETTGRDE